MKTKAIRKMKPRLFLLSLSALTLIGCLSGTPKASKGPESSILEIHEYAKSFIGLSIAAAMTKLEGANLKEGTWSEEGVGGKNITAEFPKHRYTVDLFFHKKAVIAASILVIEDG